MKVWLPGGSYLGRFALGGLDFLELDRVAARGTLILHVRNRTWAPVRANTGSAFLRVGFALPANYLLVSLFPARPLGLSAIENRENEKCNRRKFE